MWGSQNSGERTAPLSSLVLAAQDAHGDAGDDEENGDAVKVVEFLAEEELGGDDVDDECPGSGERYDGFLNEPEGHEVESIARGKEREGNNADESFPLDAPVLDTLQPAASRARGAEICGWAWPGDNR